MGSYSKRSKKESEKRKKLLVLNISRVAPQYQICFLAQTGTKVPASCMMSSRFWTSRGREVVYQKTRKRQLDKEKTLTNDTVWCWRQIQETITAYPNGSSQEQNMTAKEEGYGIQLASCLCLLYHDEHQTSCRDFNCPKGRAKSMEKKRVYGIE